MKFWLHSFCKTALHLAVELNNIEIIKILLAQDSIDCDVKDDKITNSSLMIFFSYIYDKSQLIMLKKMPKNYSILNNKP